MKEFTRESLSCIPHGKPPLAVQKQQSQIDALLTSDGSPEIQPETNGVAVVAPNHSDDRIRRVDPSPTKPAMVTEIVRLEFVPAPGHDGMPIFRLKIDVGEVCITEYYISLLVVSDLGFEPTGTMKFKLTHGENVYPVIFAGCSFEFKSVGIRGVSFLRDKPNES
jgi:hypothetical protein